MNAPCLFIQRLGVDSLDVKLGPKATMRQIAIEVAARHGSNLAEFQGPARCRSIAHPRQEAMALIYATGRYSHPQIGRFFNRDHTTVIWAVLQHAKRMSEVKGL